MASFKKALRQLLPQRKSRENVETHAELRDYIIESAIDHKRLTWRGKRVVEAIVNDMPPSNAGMGQVAPLDQVISKNSGTPSYPDRSDLDEHNNLDLEVLEIAQTRSDSDQHACYVQHEYRSLHSSLTNHTLTVTPHEKQYVITDLQLRAHGLSVSYQDKQTLATFAVHAASAQINIEESFGCNPIRDPVAADYLAIINSSSSSDDYAPDSSDPTLPVSNSWIDNVFHPLDAHLLARSISVWDQGFKCTATALDNETASGTLDPKCQTTVPMHTPEPPTLFTHSVDFFVSGGTLMPEPPDNGFAKDSGQNSIEHGDASLQTSKTRIDTETNRNTSPVTINEQAFLPGLCSDTTPQCSSACLVRAQVLVAPQLPEPSEERAPAISFPSLNHFSFPSLNDPTPFTAGYYKRPRWRHRRPRHRRQQGPSLPLPNYWSGSMPGYVYGILMQPFAYLQPFWPSIHNWMPRIMPRTDPPPSQHSDYSVHDSSRENQFANWGSGQMSIRYGATINHLAAGATLILNSAAG